MKLQHIYKTIVAAMLVTGAVSCEKNFLDTRIDIEETDETLNTDYTSLVNFANAPYVFMRNEFTIMDDNLFAPVSDEAVQTNAAANVRRFNNGSWNSIDNPDNYYNSYYSGIRAANYFLEISGDYKAFLAKNRDTVSIVGKDNYVRDTMNMHWYRGEAHILRAFFYFELAKRYGGVPLLTRTLSLDEETHLPKNTYDEVIDFIVKEVDTYKDSLQVNWKTSAFSSNDGRLTKGAALALKGRALLYAASPLHNTNSDPAKWQKAAAALNEFIVLAQGAGAYALHTDYRNYFLQNNVLSSNETIWAIRYTAGNSLEKANYPIGTPGGNSGITPTHDLVAEYELKGAADPNNPYANRDPRLGFTIVTNNSTWNSRTIDQSAGAVDDMKKANTSRTGYYLKKFLNDNMNLVQGATQVHHWPVYRYAEVLLEYAEAMNEAYGPDNNNGFTLSAKQALNRVRARTGVAMPDVTVADKSAFRTAVKHERRVELAFENYRYWDLLRWKEAETVLNQPVHGVTVTKNGSNFVYNTVVVENRVFAANKMYYYPFPQTEVLRSKGILKQNTGW